MLVKNTEAESKSDFINDKGDKLGCLQGTDGEYECADQAS